MNEDLSETRCPPSPNFPVHTLAEVDDTGPDDEPPAEVSETVLRGIEGERGDIVGVGGITNEATGSVGVKADHEEERQMMGVPEGLEALLANLVVRGGVHQDHDEQHEVTGDTTGLPVMDVQSPFRSNLCIH